MPKKTAAPKKTATPVPDAPVETREAKLKRLATSRVMKARNGIRLLGNLSAYKPTDADVDKIMQAIGETCAAVEARLRGTRKDSTEFTL